MTKKKTVSSRLAGKGFGRISTALVAVGVLLVGAGLFGAWRVFRLQQRGDTMLSDNVASIRAAEELETIVREVRYRLKRYLATGDGVQLEKVMAQMPEAERRLAESGELAMSTREEDLVARMSQGQRQLRGGLDSLREGVGAEEGRAGEGVSEEVGEESLTDTELAILDNLADEVIPNKILVSLHKYIEHNDDELTSSGERNQANARHLIFGLVLLGGGGGVAGLLAGVLIAKRISNTLVQLSVPVRDTAGKLNEVVGPVAVSGRLGFSDLQSVLQTVSERVTTVVERFQEREREVLRSEQLAAVGQLAAGMAHELRNPLTAVKAVLQLAETPSELSARDLQVINEEVRRLEQSVQRFLDFARPPDPENRPVELNRLLGDSVELLGRRAEMMGVDLRCELAGDERLVMADVAQLRQVILNLILNGCDAASSGGSVRVWLEESDPQVGRRRKGSHGGAPREDAQGGGGDRRDGSVPEGGVTLVVADSGPGLPGDLGDRIFDPFVSTKDTGLGLGLSICRRIVEAHGGTIRAVRTPRRGAADPMTELRVWLPDRPIVPQEVSRQTAAEKPAVRPEVVSSRGDLSGREDMSPAGHGVRGHGVRGHGVRGQVAEFRVGSDGIGSGSDGIGGREQVVTETESRASAPCRTC